jgi:hypothetical protein
MDYAVLLLSVLLTIIALSMSLMSAVNERANSPLSPMKYGYVSRTLNAYADGKLVGNSGSAIGNQVWTYGVHCWIVDVFWAGFDDHLELGVIEMYDNVTTVYRDRHKFFTFKDITNTDARMLLQKQIMKPTTPPNNHRFKLLLDLDQGLLTMEDLSKQRLSQMTLPPGNYSAYVQMDSARKLVNCIEVRYCKAFHGSSTISSTSAHSSTSSNLQ